MVNIKESLYYRRWKLKYKNYPLASGLTAMIPFANWVKEWSSLKVKNVFEIGANYAQDAEMLRHCFGLEDKNVYVFEAHPELCQAIKKLHPQFHTYNCAVYNKAGIMDFNIVDINSGNSGVSTLMHDLKRIPNEKIQIQTICMKDFMEENNVKTIDFLKLDVEGVNYEVLDGFGDRLKDVHSLHIESEHAELYEGETLWGGVKEKLETSGFEMIYFQRYSNQSDSFWIQKEYLLC